MVKHEGWIESVFEVEDDLPLSYNINFCKR